MNGVIGGNSHGTKRPIGPLSLPPSAFTEDVSFTHPGGSAELRCTYERNGAMYVGGLLFKGVRAYRFHAEGHCTPWHVEDAYDTLVEVEASEWVAELLAAEPSKTGGQWKIRHFLIYIDSAGAYEVAAVDCEWLPEQAAS
ncbi:hypothetical protein J7E25_10680 [Agromyces sp. ISL-38]|uniref:hypothetical protein n=1 Tax=Agromyces sp. ISL-38 TaxID=2819107 RepID=UPI001BE8C37B|nr:hypothetical protein [Agromyces sp. ISL-38]MBT2499563.1 hypothetical protein [Agromyces sp. ISL-38]